MAESPITEWMDSLVSTDQHINGFRMTVTTERTYGKTFSIYHENTLFVKAHVERYVTDGPFYINICVPQELTVSYIPIKDDADAPKKVWDKLMMLANLCSVWKKWDTIHRMNRIIGKTDQSERLAVGAHEFAIRTNHTTIFFILETLDNLVIEIVHHPITGNVLSRLQTHTGHEQERKMRQIIQHVRMNADSQFGDTFWIHITDMYKPAYANRPITNPETGETRYYLTVPLTGTTEPDQIVVDSLTGYTDECTKWLFSKLVDPDLRHSARSHSDRLQFDTVHLNISNKEWYYILTANEHTADQVTCDGTINPAERIVFIHVYTDERGAFPINEYYKYDNLAQLQDAVEHQIYDVCVQINAGKHFESIKS